MLTVAALSLASVLPSCLPAPQAAKPTPQDKVKPADQKPPAPRPSRIYLPPKPHSAELTAVVASLAGQARFALSFKDAPLGKIVPTIGKISGLNIIVSKKAAAINATWRSEGPTLQATLDEMAQAGDLYVVVEPNAVIRIVSPAEFRLRIKVRGGAIGQPMPGYVPQIEFRMLAYPRLGRLDVDLAAEKKRLLAWLEQGDNRRAVLQNPMRIVSYHGLTRQRGGRLSPAIRWYPHRIEARDAKRFSFAYHDLTGAVQRAVLPMFDDARRQAGPRSKDDCLLEFIAVDLLERGFTNVDFDLSKFRKSEDQNGSPVLLYEMSAKSARAYSDLSARRIRQSMAIILDGYMISAPTFISRIPGRGQIQGFSGAKIDAMLAGLRQQK